MFKKTLFFIFFVVGMEANLVDGIALIVNNKPITLYDIDQEMLNTTLSKEEAVSKLIDDIIYKQEIKKYNIDITLLDVDNYIEKLSSANHMNLLDFKMLIRQKEDYDQFIEKIKKQLTHQELIKKIAKGHLKIANDDDMKIYYNNHKDEYTIANSIDVIAYVSKNKNLLEQVKQNPMFNTQGVMSQNITFKQTELNPQVKYILNNTKNNEFSVIFNQGGNYNIFFVKNKNDIKTLSFDKVKKEIFNKIMTQREQSYLQNYFETLKITADVKILR